MPPRLRHISCGPNIPRRRQSITWRGVGLYAHWDSILVCLDVFGELPHALAKQLVQQTLDTLSIFLEFQLLGNDPGSDEHSLELNTTRSPGSRARASSIDIPSKYVAMNSRAGRTSGYCVSLSIDRMPSSSRGQKHPEWLRRPLYTA